MTCKLKKVELQADVYMVCLQHALSTEIFEVMGLLIGDNHDGITSISALKILIRSDKKKDRVEISPDQLLKATSEAEQLAYELDKKMRVVGWYHSHPHITVCPSQIDIRTQGMYQTMESSFVGLIFSVFTEDKITKEQDVFVTCFQSKDDRSIEIPLEIMPTLNISMHCAKTLIELPQILIQEEEDMSEGCREHPDILASILNTAVRTRALGHVIDIITRPLVHTLLERVALNKIRSKYLEQQIHCLKKELEQQ